ncbi:MAG: hypothetical protein AB8H79_20785 [Myxococcota bacterium]
MGVALDPIIAARWRAARNRRRDRGLLGSLGRLLLVVVGIGALSVLVRPVFLGFLDEGPGLAAGVGGIVLRLAVVLVGLAGIEVYDGMIRGEDREVLAVLPVDPAQAVRASLLGVISRRWWLLPGVAALLLPIGLESSWTAWAAAVGALAGVQIFAWPASAVVHLLAVQVARSEVFAPFLDLVRGASSRPQAAFIYAPGVVLLAAAGIAYAASAGAAWVVEGYPIGWGLLVIGPILAAVLSLWVPALARSSWFRATAVLAEIDSAYSALATSEADRLHVYMDWMIRFLPESWRRFALNDLRHGWRGRRIWLTGAWVLGIAAALAGWTEVAAGPSRAVAVACLAVCAVASVVLVLHSDEPEFLRWWLPRPRPRATLARAAVVWAWAQPAIWPAVLISAFMGGISAGAWVLAAAQLVLGLVLGLGLLCSRFGRLGPWVYGSGALAVVAAVVLTAGLG